MHGLLKQLLIVLGSNKGNTKASGLYEQKPLLHSQDQIFVHFISLEFL